MRMTVRQDAENEYVVYAVRNLPNEQLLAGVDQVPRDGIETAAEYVAEEMRGDTKPEAITHYDDIPPQA